MSRKLVEGFFELAAYANKFISGTVAVHSIDYILVEDTKLGGHVSEGWRMKPHQELDDAPDCPVGTELCEYRKRVQLPPFHRFR